jgi:tRNA modification GTPase
LEVFQPINFSCKKSIQQIIEKLEEYLDKKSSADDLILISKRQINAVKKALEYIHQSYRLLEDGELELFAYNLNEAIYHISSITTLFERDEILDKMFGSFCLGK